APLVVVAARGVLADERLACAVLQVEDLVLQAVRLDGHVVAGDRGNLAHGGVLSQTGEPTVRGSSIFLLTQRRFCMRTRTSPSSFMSRWKVAAHVPESIGGGTGWR